MGVFLLGDLDKGLYLQPGCVAHGGDLHRHRGKIQQRHLDDARDHRRGKAGHDRHGGAHLDHDQRTLKAGGDLAAIHPHLRQLLQRRPLTGGQKAVECAGGHHALPAFLSSYKSKFELAFIHQSAPGIMVNIKGDNIGNIVSDNHYTMAKAKLNKDNGDTFYYVFDESSAVKLRDSESYGFNGYVAMFEKGEAVHYDSVEKASEELNLPNLADAIEANNAAALAGEPDEFGRRNCPYIETRDGLWAIRVDPTFYLTTAGLAIDTDCHVLTEDKKAIPGLYAAGDVCGSIEEKDAKQYGMGFDAALTYGYIMGETLKKEI